jgi:hypothetical protein
LDHLNTRSFLPFGWYWPSTSGAVRIRTWQYQSAPFEIWLRRFSLMFDSEVITSYWKSSCYNVRPPSYKLV